MEYLYVKVDKKTPTLTINHYELNIYKEADSPISKSLFFLNVQTMKRVIAKT